MTRRAAWAAVPVLLGATLTAMTATTAARATGSACPSWTVTQRPIPGGGFDAAAMLPSGDAWAVGSASGSAEDGDTLVQHWNGTTWRTQPSQDPSNVDNYFNGVAAGSAANVWAVGADHQGTLALSCT